MKALEARRETQGTTHSKEFLLAMCKKVHPEDPEKLD